MVSALYCKGHIPSLPALLTAFNAIPIKWKHNQIHQLFKELPRVLFLSNNASWARAWYDNTTTKSSIINISINYNLIVWSSTVCAISAAKKIKIERWWRKTYAAYWSLRAALMTRMLARDWERVPSSIFTSVYERKILKILRLLSYTLLYLNRTWTVPAMSASRSSIGRMTSKVTIEPTNFF